MWVTSLPLPNLVSRLRGVNTRAGPDIPGQSRRLERSESALGHEGSKPVEQGRSGRDDETLVGLGFA